MFPKSLALLLFASLLWAPFASGAPAVQDEVDRLFELISEKRDYTRPGVFDRLAKVGNRRSFDALQRAIGLLQTQTPLERAYGAFSHYRSVPELGTEALEWVAQECTSGKAVKRRAAVVGLGRFGEVAADELVELAGSSKDPEVRARAVEPLLPILSDRGEPAGLRLILENAVLRLSGSRAKLMEALNAFMDADDDEVFFAQLKRRALSTNVKLMIVEALTPRAGTGVTRALIAALAGNPPAVQYAALLALDERGTTEHTSQLRKLIRSRDEAIRCQAIISLSRALGADERWQTKLEKLTRDKDPATRQGAAIGLVEVRTPHALELLHGLLADPDRAVRAEAVRQVGNLRRRESIPVLIQRVNAETGRQKGDILTTLRLLTGVDQGTTYERWKRWWEGEGAAFEMPAYEDALRDERERQRQQARGGTVTTFYGLNVVSDRICFVLDVSGSMRTPSGKSTRIEVAKRELAETLSKYPVGNLFNLIFFSTDVFPWQDAVVPMDERTRGSALSYVARQTSNGFTAIYDALELAFADRRIDTIFLLTDGNPEGGSINDVDEIRSEVRRWNVTRGIRIHGISVGGKSPLLENLAQDSGGQYRQAR